MSGLDILHREVAYRKWAIPKLKKELLVLDDEELVSKALLTLIDMSYDPEAGSQIICHNVISRLGKLVNSPSPFIRQKVAILLQCIASLPFGCTHIADNKYLLRQILEGLNDPRDEVRHDYYKTVYVLLTSGFVLQELTDVGYVEALISKLSSEDHEYCLLYIIHTLEHLGHTSRTQKAIQIQHGVVEAAHKLLMVEGYSDDTSIGLLGVLAQLMKHPDGKKRFSVDMFREMVELILNGQDDSVQLLVNSIRVLSFAAIITEVKRLLVHDVHINDLIEKLMNLTKHNHKPLQMAAIQLLTIIAETKYGRDYLQSKMEELKDVIFANGDRNDVGEAVQVLMKVIQWTV
ncbi:hypothetical protein WDU94_001577 [Cyamophila willieti]